MTDTLAKRVSIGIFALFVFASVTLTWAQFPPPNVDTRVLATLRAEGKVTFFVVLKEQADTSQAVAVMDHAIRGEFVVDSLTGVAARSQRSILARLAEVGADATSFWIVNTIKVTTSDEQLITELAARSDVAYIMADELWRIPEPQQGVGEPTIQAVEWGVTRVGAPGVWERFGVRGENIVVANIDTGVQFDHPALVMQYRGLQPDGSFDHNYNWHDPSQICPPGAPCDNNNHGTHTMGTMVGDDGASNQIGVAPRARWIAAKGCETTSCSTSALLSSGQWVLAPTDVNGQNPRPDLRPHVVNNSWGSSTSNPFFQMTVQNWRAAGIFPAFANGNPGSACGQARVPGAYPESFGVGATDINDNIASFSGRGPAVFFGGIVKPNVSAPGVNVRSSIRNSIYGNFSGTSMATPHVAGAVALLWSANPALIGNIEGTSELLQATARHRPSTQCGEEGPPNNVYGWGIIDVLAAVERSAVGGTLRGTVTDADTGATLASVSISANDFIASTDENGVYQFSNSPAGSYTVSASLPGYMPATASVEVVAGQTTIQDFALSPTGNLQGTVTDAATGAPLAGVSISANEFTASTDENGVYQFADIPPGTYTVLAQLEGYGPATAPVDVAAGVITIQNFSLELQAVEAGPLVSVSRPPADFSRWQSAPRRASRRASTTWSRSRFPAIPFVVSLSNHERFGLEGFLLRLASHHP